MLHLAIAEEKVDSVFSGAASRDQSTRFLLVLMAVSRSFFRSAIGCVLDKVEYLLQSQTAIDPSLIEHINKSLRYVHTTHYSECYHLLKLIAIITTAMCYTCCDLG